MDLNICLYCEKHLIEEGVSFCSLDCQAKEASKPIYGKPPSLQFVQNSSKYYNTPYKLSRRNISFSYSRSSNANLPVYYYPMLTSSSTSTVSSTSSASSALMDYHQPQQNNNKKQNYSSFFHNIQRTVYTKYF